jgi:hypothetical protein
LKVRGVRLLNRKTPFSFIAGLVAALVAFLPSVKASSAFGSSKETHSSKSRQELSTRKTNESVSQFKTKKKKKKSFDAS